MSAPTRRLIQISVLAHLRAAGWLPWLLLLLWAAVSAAGEPELLRTFGVHILHQAVGGGAVVVGAALLLACRQFTAHDPWLRLATHLLLLAMLAVAQHLLALAFDLAYGNTVFSSVPLVGAASFFWVWAPTAAALAVGGRERSQAHLKACLTVACLGVSSTAATAAWNGPPAGTWLAPGLALAGCLLAMAANQRSTA